MNYRQINDFAWLIQKRKLIQLLKIIKIVIFQPFSKIVNVNSKKKLKKDS